MITGESIKLSVQLDILLLALPLGALFLIALHILRHVMMYSLKEHAHAPTNHHRVIIGSSNFLKVTTSSSER